jgi:phthalate 4,5-dioxygenase oxygenase subunit
VVGKIDYACNYVQAIEGAIDSSHGDLLHSGYEAMHWTREQIEKVDPSRVREYPARWETQDTDYGFRYAAIRKAASDPERLKQIRVTVFAVPFHCLLADVPHMFVPADDELTWFYDVRTNTKAPVDRAKLLAQRGTRVGSDVGPDHRKLRTLQNNFMQDRKAMRARQEPWSYSGVAWGKPHQDMAVIESMGPIYDRTKEHLGVQDVGVVRMRQRMLAMVRHFIETGEAPGEDGSIPWGRIQGAMQVIPNETPWQTVAAFAGEFVPDIDGAVSPVTAGQRG